MVKGRMEAFSDGVIAIVITIMVFDLKAPSGSDVAALLTTVPSALTYLLSFIYLAIYWNNHHHLLQLTEHIDGRVLWANLHLLFWLSLIPFGTAWMRGTSFASLPVAVYGCILLFSSLAWSILQSSIIAHQGLESPVRKAVGRDLKGKASSLLYLVAIGLSFSNHWGAVAIYVAVALFWLVPDQRFENRTRQQQVGQNGK